MTAGLNNAKQRRRLLKKAFSNSPGRWRVWLAMAGFVLGLILLLGALNLALGINRAIQAGERHAEYLIVNKRVTVTGMLTYVRPGFTEAEIQELRDQDFVRDVGEFVTSRFRVSALADPRVSDMEDAPAGGDPGGFGMSMPLYSELFFESLPDRFLDVDPDKWHWDPELDYIPIVISREFINLYNFSFALAQGLPQIPESVIGGVGGRITVSGSGGEKRFRARVVGLSDRVPSILVPREFMTWANREIAQEEQRRPSRLMIKTDRPADPEMLEYFKNRDLQVNSERLRAGRIGRMAMMGLSAVGALGGLLVALALFLFVLLFRVVLAESAERIRLLLLLGYTPAMLTAFALRRFWFSLIAIALLAAAVLGTVFPLVYQRLREVGFDPGPVFFPLTVGAGIVILALAGVINLASVRRTIRRKAEYLS